MRTDRIPFLAAAFAIALQIVALGSSPYMAAQHWHLVWSCLAYAALTLLLWIATEGKRAWLVPGAVMFLGAVMGDLAAAAPAALLTGVTLAMLQGKPTCVES